MSSKMYQQQGGPDMSNMGGAGPDMGAGNAGGANDDGVVDADFKEV